MLEYGKTYEVTSTSGLYYTVADTSTGEDIISSPEPFYV